MFSETFLLQVFFSFNFILCNFSLYELEEKFSIQIQYLELRNKINLDLSIKKQNSKLFVAYYLNRVRLIDNF